MGTVKVSRESSTILINRDTRSSRVPVPTDGTPGRDFSPGSRGSRGHRQEELSREIWRTQKRILVCNGFNLLELRCQPLPRAVLAFMPRVKNSPRHSLSCRRRVYAILALRKAHNAILQLTYCLYAAPAFQVVASRCQNRVFLNTTSLRNP